VKFRSGHWNLLFQGYSANLDMSAGNLCFAQFIWPWKRPIYLFEPTADLARNFGQNTVEGRPWKRSSTSSLRNFEEGSGTFIHLTDLYEQYNQHNRLPLINALKDPMHCSLRDADSHGFGKLMSLDDGELAAARAEVKKRSCNQSGCGVTKCINYWNSDSYRKSRSSNETLQVIAPNGRKHRGCAIIILKNDKGA